MDVSTKTLLDELRDKILKLSNLTVNNSEEFYTNDVENLDADNENNTIGDKRGIEDEAENPNMWVYNSIERKLSPKDLWILSKHLKDFLEYLTGLTEILTVTYQYPIKLKQQIVRDTTNLASLQREVQASVDEVKRLKRDKKAIKKDMKENLKILAKLQKTESEELEKIVQCDYAAFEKWNEIKNFFCEEKAKENLQNIKKERNVLDALEILIVGEMKKHGIATEESYDSLNDEFWLNTRISRSRNRNIRQQPSNKKLYKKASQMDNESTETYEDAEDGSIDTTSYNPETNTTRMSTNDSLDLFQLNPTTITFGNNLEDRIILPAIDHPHARERLASRSNGMEQRLAENLQNYGTELILQSIYTMNSTD